MVEKLISLHKRLVFIVLILISANAQSDDWFTIDSDGGSIILARILPADSTASPKARLSIKIVHKSPRDMMGLTYNSTIYEYLISCSSDEIYQRKQFLFNGDQLVWTFPESTKKLKASVEIAEKTLRIACDRWQGQN